MTDINHPSEAEMMSIRNIFDRAANAIVQASELAKQVAELKTSFDNLTNDFNTMLGRNNELVTSLNEVRSQRDMAMAERDTANNRIAELETKLANAESETKHYHEQLNRTLDKLEDMTRDRDEVMTAWHKAQSEADTAYDKLKKIQHALGLPETPAPTTVKADPWPEANVALTEPKPDAVQVPISESHNPEPTTTTTSYGMALPEPTTQDRQVDPFVNPTEPWKHD